MYATHRPPSLALPTAHPHKRTWAVPIQQWVAPPADDGVLAVKGGLVVGAVVLAGDEQARVLQQAQRGGSGPGWPEWGQ